MTEQPATSTDTETTETTGAAGEQAGRSGTRDVNAQLAGRLLVPDTPAVRAAEQRPGAAAGDLEQTGELELGDLEQTGERA